MAKQTEPDDVDPAVLYDDWSGLAKPLPARVPGPHPLPAGTAVSRTPRTPGAPFVLGSPAGDPRPVGSPAAAAPGLQHSTGRGTGAPALLDGRYGTGEEFTT
ncbi:hypothetical protein ACIQWZ_22090 [Streptomyces sp. NPDC098077]|uniref:hypothetical protein n=1 Tax=Streptomyces sp. NPDC098077 TaxID=3366093 RepID=UPI0038246DC6